MTRRPTTHRSVASGLGMRFVERLAHGLMVDRTAKQNRWGPLKTIPLPKALQLSAQTGDHHE